MKITTYRDLETWKKAMDLVELAYRISQRLPTDERFGLISQMQRAAVSIPANIAEGHGRLHRKDFLRYLSIARGSLMELETHVTIAVRLNLVDRESAVPLWESAQEVGRLLNGLIAALKRDPPTRDQGSGVRDQSRMSASPPNPRPPIPDP